MQFRTLGPLEVVGERGPIEIEGPIRRRLLCRLLLSIGRPVSLEALERAGWGDEPPRSARRTVQSHLSRLRAQGIPVVRDGDGYRLDAPSDAVDAHRFRSSCGGGALTVRTVAELREALGWWRGDAWTDLDGTARAEDQTRLRELRSAVEERLVFCDLAAGRLAAVVAETERLVGEDPRRETRWALWAAGLAAGQRRADALVVLHDARAQLASAGLTPGPVLAALEAEVLGDGDVAALVDVLAGTLGPPPPAPTTSLTPTGRQPTGTVTFLFTDVEGSTRMWAAHSDAMDTALERHDEIVRSSVAEHDGYVFATAGDSFAVAFALATEAVAAAVDIQDRLRREDWPDPVVIRVRMGLHTGTASMREGDYFGPDVNIAARIEQAAHGGQILASAATTALAGDARARSSLGEHRLQDIDGAHEIVQIGEGAFPPIRTTPRPALDLPGATTDLVGRDDELEELRQLLETARVVTVSGPGGIGKTSLARTIAEGFAASGDVEVWWCDLVPTHRSEVLGAISRAVGIASHVEDPPTLVRGLAGRPPTVLVLDNCEHVVSDVRPVVDALVAGTEVQVIATSRAPLEVAQEQVHVVPPIRESGAAVTIFERASRAVGGAPDPDERELRRVLCDRVDRIPLAIELVAARTRSVSLADLAERLDRIVLGPGRRDRTDRHATMTAAIAWSVDLLGGEVAAGLGALSVFEGGFDLAAAEAVLGDEVDALDLLDALVAHSLVTVDRPGSGHARYRLLEPIRQFAAHHLLDDPDPVRDRHLDHYLGRLEAAYATLATESCMPLVRLIDLDMGNLGAVHRWALASGRIDDDLRLYRPLLCSFLQDRLEPFRWAMETVHLDGIDAHDGWGVVLVAGLTYQTVIRGDLAEQARLAERVPDVSSDDAGIDLVLLAQAGAEGDRNLTPPDAEAGRALYERADRGDVFVRFLRYFYASTFRVQAARAGGGDVLAASRSALAELDEGLGWSARIGARNFEAAILELSGQYLLEVDPQQAFGVAREAEALARSLGLAYNADMASLHQVKAAWLGVDIGEPLELRLAEVLDSAVRSQQSDRVTMALPAAGLILAEAGRHEAAALCGRQPPHGHPRAELDLEDTPGVRAAREQAESLDVFEIGRRVRDALRDLHADN